MRTVKRLLIFLRVIGLGFVWFLISAALAAYSFALLGLLHFVFVPWLSLFLMGLFLFVRDVQAREFKHDVAEFQRGRTRSRAAKVLIWIPSLLAALVLFFFPIASHLPNPGSHFLTHYRVPIPWTVTVYEFQELADDCSLVEAHVRNFGMGQFGAMLFWDRSAFTSSLTFGNFRSDPDVWSSDRRGATELSRKEIVVGDIAVSCHQYTRGSKRWYANCQTPPGTGRYDFYARFQGSEADLPLFYSIVSGIKRWT